MLVFTGPDLPQRLEADGAGDEFFNIVQLGRAARPLRFRPFFRFFGPWLFGCPFSSFFFRAFGDTVSTNRIAFFPPLGFGPP